MRPVVILLLLAVADATAQVQSRPTDPPLVTAANESWYRLREPIQFAGELYYPVYARRGVRDVIYLPTRDGDRAAPYRAKR